MKATAVIRKDEWIVSKPWCADLMMEDELGESKFTSWMVQFRTKKSLVENIRMIRPSIKIIYNGVEVA